MSSKFLFYDQRGIGEFSGADELGRITRINRIETWRHGWTNIVPGNFQGGGGTSFQNDLLFYDGTSGFAQFYKTEGIGGIRLIRSHTGWHQIGRKSFPVDSPIMGLPTCCFTTRETVWLNSTQRTERGAFVCCEPMSPGGATGPRLSPATSWGLVLNRSAVL
jgi:hypothetical protein